jgi:SAM-dependent methyltransferase
MKRASDGGELYGRWFFESQAPTSRESAGVIVPLVVQLVRPTSAVDVGCGTGAWLSILNEAGVEDILGIDGEYVDRSLLEIPQDRFLPRDLRLPFKVDRQFDLVVSLEVAEHLPADCADQFVDSLVGLGSAVLFSAAIPNQGGNNHINERWQTYWASLFEDRGYTCLDAIRPKIWDDERVVWWYRQNTFLFVSPHLLEGNAALQQELFGRSPWPRSIVHPRLLETAARRLEAASHPPKYSLADRAKRALPSRVKTVLRAGQNRLKGTLGGPKRRADP